MTLQSPEQAVAAVRNELDQDGHFVENATVLIVSLVTDVRNRSANPIDAQMKLIDALAGKPNEVSAEAGRIMVLQRALGNQQLVEAATLAGIYSSANQRTQIKEAHARGFAELRDVVLVMTLPSRQGETPITLGSKIQALIPTR